MTDECDDADQSTLRSETLLLVDELLTVAVRFQLPSPSRDLIQLRNNLAEESSRLVLLGEASAGKSTFLNALLGSQVLPTDVDVATNQVVQVSRGEQEEYLLKFEDGSSRSISRDELVSYGAQTDSLDANDRTHLDLLWIEVATPSKFCPERIVFCDTPGLGSLYAGHAQVTRRYLPYADAVIFVLDSARPILDREIQFLTEVIEFTTNVFFIQTKIDQHSRDTWKQVQKRNEEILAERFAVPLGRPQVWPISSINLLSASSTPGSEVLLLTSRYPALARALIEFIERTCIIPRSVETLVLAWCYFEAGRESLATRLEDLRSLSETESAAYRERLNESWQAFQNEWGDGGSLRYELQQSIRRVMTLSRQAFQDALAPGGPVASAQEARINAVTSVPEANALGATIGEDTVAASIDAWMNICRRNRENCQSLIEPFLKATEDMIPTMNPVGKGEKVEVSPFTAVEASTYDRARLSYTQAIPIYAIAGIAMSFLGPFVWIPAAGGIVWTFARGWKSTGKAMTKQAKGELQQHLSDVLRQVSFYFFAVDLAEERGGRTEEYFSALEADVLNAVDQIAQKRITDIQDESAHLEAQAELRASERNMAAKEVQNYLSEWEIIGQRIASLLGGEDAKRHLQALIAQDNPGASSGGHESRPNVAHQS